jgi:hypothetical protein
MASATAVRLPRSQKARFPAACIGCGCENPGSGITIWTWSVSWWAVITLLAVFWSKTERTRAPACRRCAWALRFRRLGWWAVIAAAIAVSIFLTKHWLPKAPKLVGRGVMLGIAVVLFLPAGIWESFHPPSFELTIEGDDVLYQFREFAYALRFAELNEAEIGG